MDKIVSPLFPTPNSNASFFSAYNEHYESPQSLDLLHLNIIESSSHSFLPQGFIKFNGSMGYQTPNIHASSIPLPAARKDGMMAKKSIHKYVERQRRKDIKALYSSLGSLLPDKYIIGRRSTAEHLSETMSYIKALLEKVKKLTQHRDKMRKQNLCETLPFSALSETFPAVCIHSAGSGVSVTASAFKSHIKYSDLLSTLEKNGLDILSSSCIAVNDKVFHTIHGKVWDADSFESRNLYKKLWNLVCQNSSDAEQVQS